MQLPHILSPSLLFSSRPSFHPFGIQVLFYILVTRIDIRATDISCLTAFRGVVKKLNDLFEINFIYLLSKQLHDLRTHKRRNSSKSSTIGQFDN